MKRFILGVLLTLLGAAANASTFICGPNSNSVAWITAEACFTKFKDVNAVDNNGNRIYLANCAGKPTGPVIVKDVGWGANPAAPNNLDMYWDYTNTSYCGVHPSWVSLGYCAVGPAGGSVTPTNDLSCVTATNGGNFPLGASPFTSPLGTSSRSWPVSGAPGSYTDTTAFVASSPSVYLEVDGLGVDANDYTTVTGLSTSPALGTASCSNNICILSSTSATTGTAYTRTITGSTVGTVTAHQYVSTEPAPSTCTSWTPTIQIGNGAGCTTGITYNSSGTWGTYSIDSSGNKVHVNGAVTLTNKGTCAASSYITMNLPLTTSNSQQAVPFLIDGSGFTGLTGTGEALLWYGQVYLTEVSSTGTAWMGSSALTNTTGFNFAFDYYLQ